MCFSVNEMCEMWNGWHRRDGVMDGEWGICIVLVWMGKGVMVMDRGRFRNSGRGYYTFYLYQLCILEKIINYPRNIQKVFTIKFSFLPKTNKKKKKKKKKIQKVIIILFGILTKQCLFLCLKWPLACTQWSQRGFDTGKLVWQLHIPINYLLKV